MPGRSGPESTKTAPAANEHGRLTETARDGADLPDDSGRADPVDGEPSVRRVSRRWLPLAFGVAFTIGTLLVADTAPADIIRYAGYAGFAVLLPGTLVFRALRRTPFTLVEDLAFGTAVGLTLELPAWAIFSLLHLQSWLWLWPLSIVVLFAGMPRLRRHWWVRGYVPTPVGWSWSVAGICAFFTGYLSLTFLERNPVLPTSEGTRQYLDLAYQLSLAGEAKHHFPPHVPQAAAEPLHYHWFGHAHMAATSLIGHLDLPVVALRLAVPGLCVATIVILAVAGWRVSGRPYVGAGAAALLFVVGEVNFTHPVTLPFGTQATFVVWHGMSMIYSWLLLIALLPMLADRIDRTGAGRVPTLGPGAWVLAALLLFASVGAKASSVPVVAVALAGTFLVLLVTQRRLPWAVAVAGLLAATAQVLVMATLFAFQTYGVALSPLSGLSRFWAAPAGRPDWKHAVVVLAVIAAFLVNMQIRQAGMVPLLWLRRGRLKPAQWFLLGGTLAGPALYLAFSQPGGGNQYFYRAGFAFGVILSAWGYALVADRARMDRRAVAGLAAGAVAFAGVLVLIQRLSAGPVPAGKPYSALLPLMTWAVALGVTGLLVAVAWRPTSRIWPALRGRGAIVALTAVLVAGAPGLLMDAYKSWQAPNGGAYFTVSMPRSRVEAARWVRAHSDPDDVLATNVHCLSTDSRQRCDARSFWLSAYAERRVAVEGWGFAPRVASSGAFAPFWDSALLRLNDEAFTAPTTAGLAQLRERHGVRWLVVDRSVGTEPAVLQTLADRRFDNGRLAVYELR